MVEYLPNQAAAIADVALQGARILRRIEAQAMPLSLYTPLQTLFQMSKTGLTGHDRRKS
jgi:hypothetical protein